MSSLHNYISLLSTPIKYSEGSYYRTFLRKQFIFIHYQYAGTMTSEQAERWLLVNAEDRFNGSDVQG